MANVPAAPGTDTEGTVAQQNLTMAAAIISDYMRAHPATTFTVFDLQHYNATFTWDGSDAPIGDPGTPGSAVISTGISQVPHSPRHVVLALPGYSACYYASVTENVATQYGVALGTDAATHCLAEKTPTGALQVRSETKWNTYWPKPNG